MDAPTLEFFINSRKKVIKYFADSRNMVIFALSILKDIVLI